MKIIIMIKDFLILIVLGCILNILLLIFLLILYQLLTGEVFSPHNRKAVLIELISVDEDSRAKVLVMDLESDSALVAFSSLNCYVSFKTGDTIMIHDVMPFRNQGEVSYVRVKEPK